MKQLSVDDCIRTFTELCGKAFTEREFAGIIGLEQLATLHHGSKYKTQPLHAALKDTLGDDTLFGAGGSASPEYATKVAVTATSGTGSRPYVLANYSRSEDVKEQERPYDFIRRRSPREELQVWHAAAATSAAPGYFKEFWHEATNTQYLDGAFYHNNPVQVALREAKLLWPDCSNKPPDLLLSVGTGMYHEPNQSNSEAERLRRLAAKQ